MKKIDVRAKQLLLDQLKDHYQEACQCGLTKGGYSLCYAGQWIEGAITSRNVIVDLGTKQDQKLLELDGEEEYV